MTRVAGVHSELAELIGESKVRSGTGIERYLTDPRGAMFGKSTVVALPHTVEDVQEIVRYAHAQHRTIVPQGGNTGLVQAAGSSDPESVIVSLEKMDRIEAVDTAGNTLTVGAGAILANVCAAAAAADRLFPMHLGSYGSCQIGGLISTNAGGVSVLRYGMMRELVLGIEVVLPNGRVVCDMNRLRKNNVGYDLKQLFVGAEGTLGIVTAAVLKLFPRPAHYETALLAVPSVESALELFHLVSVSCAGMISAFEYISAEAIRIAERNLGLKCPLEGDYRHFVLIELELPAAIKETGLLAQDLQTAQVEVHWIDAVIASSETQRRALWHLRESLSEASSRTGRSISHDVSLPLAQIATFISRATTRLGTGVTVAPFGHIGDGNIHFTVIADREHDAAIVKQVNAAVFEVALQLGGSFSAEHGIGREKTELAQRTLPPEAQRLRREIKQLLDPDGIMNPETMFDIGGSLST